MLSNTSRLGLGAMCWWAPKTGWGWELCVCWAPELKGGNGGGCCLLGAVANSIQQLPRALQNLLILKNVVHQWRDVLLRKIRLLESFPHTDNQYVLPRRGCIFVKFSIKSSALFHLWASMMVLSTILHCRDARGKCWYHQEGGLQPCD